MKKQSSIEFIVDNLLLPEYGENPEWVINIIEQAKEIHRKEIEQCYEMAIHDTINFDIDKSSEEEVEHYKKEYYHETFINETNT